MVDPTTDATKAAGFFSSLEKATELPAFLLIATFILMVDNVLLYSQGHGLVAISRDEKLLNPRLAVHVVMIFVLFSLVMSIIRPVLSIILIWFVAQTYDLVRNSYLTTSRLFGMSVIDPEVGYKRYRNNLRAGYIPRVNLKDKAHASMDKYYLDILKDAEAADSAYEQRFQQLSFAVLSMIIMTAINWFWFPLEPEIGVVQELALLIGNRGGILVWSCLTAIFGLYVLLPVAFVASDDGLRWTYCPPLARVAAEEMEKLDEIDQIGPKRRYFPPLKRILRPGE